MVLFLGALLVLVITDRGHDPLWEVREPFVEQLALAPDGSELYVLVRDDANGPIVRLESRAGEDGRLLWKTDMNDSRALIAADDEGVAVATDFPRAFAVYYGADGRPRYHVALQGSPRALAVEQGRIAVSLQATESTDEVLVVREGRVERVHAFRGYVNAIDLRAQRLGVGTSEGVLTLFDPEGDVLHSTNLTLDVLTIRLAADAHAMIAGGFDMGNAAGGGVAFVDFSDEPLVEWTQRTAFGVGLVDVSADGSRAIAIEESSPRPHLHVYETHETRESWGKLLAGFVAIDETGRGGAAISPDGRTVVVGTVDGGVRAFDGRDGDQRWTFESEGTTFVGFGHTSPPFFITNARLVPNGPLEAVLLFDPASEPLSSRISTLAAGVGILLAAGGATILGVGYWRLRRTY